MDDGYRIELFAETDLVEEDVIEFWVREGAIPRAEAEVRASEVLLVARHHDSVVGVNSIYLQWSPRLSLSLWHYRIFVGREHRQSGVSTTLGLQAIAHGEMMFTTAQNTTGAGAIIEVENEDLKRTLDAAVWRWGTPEYTPDYVFIGENDKGDHVRVHYFPGALAPEAPQLSG